MGPAEPDRVTIGVNDAGRRRQHLVGEGVEVFHDPGRQGHEVRQQVEPYPDTEETAIGVGRVGRVLDAMSREVTQDFCLTHPHQWPDKPTGARRQDGQSAGTRAPQQAQQERFRAIVGVVGSGYVRRTGGLSGTLERPITGRTSARLQISALLDGDARDRKGHLMALGQQAGEAELGHGVRPQSVVHTMSTDGQPELRTETAQGVQQSERIATTGDRHQHVSTALEATLLTQGPAYQGE